MEHIVRDFNRGKIEDGVDESFLHHRLHGLSAGSYGVKNDCFAVCFVENPHCLHSPDGCDTNGRERDQPLIVPLFFAIDFRHATNGRCGVREN